MSKTADKKLQIPKNDEITVPDSWCHLSQQQRNQFITAKNIFRDMTPEQITEFLPDSCYVDVYKEAQKPEISKIKKLSEFKINPAGDPDELIKHRYLCKKGGLLLVGGTGYGKSSLTAQLMLNWALGKTCFGLEPVKALKFMVVQAENDEGDIAEMKDGILEYLNWPETDKAKAQDNIYFIHENSLRGGDLCKQLDVYLREVKPDILVIDPALAYIPGSINEQEAVSAFLRANIAPLITKHNCGLILIHHTNKISKDPEKNLTDISYLGAGSSEFANWHRCVLVLQQLDENLFALNAGKRGTRLEWKEPDGKSASFKRYLCQSGKAKKIYWQEMGALDVNKRIESKNNDAVLKNVPEDGLICKNDLITKSLTGGTSRRAAMKIVDELATSKSLLIHRVKRKGTNPAILLGKKEYDLSGTDLNALEPYRSSQGIYNIPVKLLKDSAKNTLN